MKHQILLSIIAFGTVLSVRGFVPTHDFRQKAFLSLEMAKRKPSMAERRKKRNAKQKGQGVQDPFGNLPKAKLDCQESPASKALDTPEKLSSPREAAEKAKELLKAQRASVDMLSMVREKIEELPSDVIMENLDNKGFFVIDDLLGDEEIISQLEMEAIQLYEAGSLEVDMANLGNGEYIGSIKGGQEQYAQCPRLVEWVVSSTKHFPDQLPDLSLDQSACMATLRVFDRKAFQASLKLLTGGEDIPEVVRPYATIVTDATEDKRRLSMQYFLTPNSWNTSCGGGISIENGESIDAKRDRLVMWKSDSTSLRTNNWKGTTELPVAPSIELHLVHKLPE